MVSSAPTFTIYCLLVLFRHFLFADTKEFVPWNSDFLDYSTSGSLCHSIQLRLHSKLTITDFWHLVAGNDHSREIYRSFTTFQVSNFVFVCSAGIRLSYFD